jgi:hypothetical protein
MAFQVLKTENTGVVYADPSDPDATIRFKHSSKPKSLNGAATSNHVTEIIFNDLTAVTIGSVDATDAVSVRVRVSASSEGMVRAGEMLAVLAQDLVTWHGESVMVGFNPTTLPSVPV